MPAVHQELLSPRRWGRAVMLVGVVLAVADVVSGFALQGWGVLIVGATLWSVGSYGSIVLRETGTGRFAVVHSRRLDHLRPLLQDWLTRASR
jgi:hypothetical protein